MRFGMLAAIAATMLVACQAEAQTAGKVSFSVGGVALEVAPPAGFCVPTGLAQAAAKMAEEADKDNATLATFYPCDKRSQPGNSDYYLIKSIKSLAEVTVEREELLKALTAEMNNPNFSAEALSTQVGEKTSKALSDLSGTDIKVTTEVRLLGRDADCVYMAGVMVAATEAGMIPMNIGGCLTAVGGRMVMVYRYAAGTTMDGAKLLLPQTRKLAMAMRVKQ